MSAQQSEYRFSFGPWNIHEGGDPFGPEVRPSVDFGRKLKMYKELGFEGIQLHDDDAVPDLESMSSAEIEAKAGELKAVLDGEGLVAEFTAPRLWEDARGIDGGFTANDPNVRKWAIDRAKVSIDIARALGTKMQVLWLAREGTYARESKNAMVAYERIIEAVNVMLAHDPDAIIAIEPKPNEPMDQAYVPTIGHALAISHMTSDPARVGGLIETAHALLAGLDPSDEMAFALAANKLYSVHLNDQNGLKYDQDKSFGAANLRTAFDQVRVLEKGNYAASGRFIGLDVKAMRTQKADVATAHLSNSRAIFLTLVDKVRTWDQATEDQLIKERNYEALELAILNHLMGV